jgi:ribosome-associated protein
MDRLRSLAMNEEENEYDYDAFGDEEEVDPDAQRESKVLKREKTLEADTIEKMAWRLMDLGTHELPGLPLDERVRDELAIAREMKPSKSRNRQVRFIAKLMRGSDLDDIEESLGSLKLTQASWEMMLKRCEYWRTQLLSEGDSALQGLMEVCPQADRQAIRQLVRRAQKELAAQKPPKLVKELFQILKELAPDST